MLSLLTILSEISLDKIIFGLLLFWIIYVFYDWNKNPEEPPRVPSFPIIGHTFPLILWPREFLDKCKRKYGDIFSVNFFGSRVYVFTNEAIRYFNKFNDLNTVEGRQEAFFFLDHQGEMEHSKGKPKHVVDAAIIVKEDLWPLLKDMLPSIIKNINLSIKSEIGQSRNENVINLEEFTYSIIGKAVCIPLLGEQLSRDIEFVKYLTKYAYDLDDQLRQGLFWKLIPFVGPKILQNKINDFNLSGRVRSHIQSKLCEYYDSKVKHVELANEEVSIVDKLYYKGLELDQISHIVLTLAFAGISTTAKNISLLITDLLAHPEYIDMLRIEQQNIIKNHSGELDEEYILSKAEIDNMPYLNSSIRETLRHRAYHLDGWRYTKTERILPNGMKIPKNSLLAIDLPTTHFNPEIYKNKDDNEFNYNPFQFIGTNLNATTVNHNFITFGIGKHACPGRFFAVQLISAFMSNLLLNYSMDTKDGKPMKFYTGDGAIPDPYIILNPLS